ncbi:16966_t:CDS:2 [Gigaspora margarita]|uniref:16966_t:CDS:1 n=1 Tax=Gigaspora margarita TaxID=4874 RepID=A0ABM8VW75_GIGMA|nr:16966_t:CDS:2 [Gigaspora margarita]
MKIFAVNCPQCQTETPISTKNKEILKEMKIVCNNCPWKDTSADYINKGRDDIGTQYQCKACSSLVEGITISHTYSMCGQCGKRLGDRELLKRPNYKKRMEEKECNGYESCGEKFKLTQENIDLLNVYGSFPYCPKCRIKDLERDVAKGSASEEDKKTLQELKKLAEVAKLEGDKITFEYNDSTTETKEINTSELQQIKVYAEKVGKNQLFLSNLEQNNNQSTSPNKSNKLLY